MIQNLNEQKAKLKEAINKEIDDYFTALESSSWREGFDINKIEELMLENRKKLKARLNKADSEIASNVEAPVKKNARSAKTH